MENGCATKYYKNILHQLGRQLIVSASNMKTRLLGRTGWAVSEVGFGGWGIGGDWGERDDVQAGRALNRFLDTGGNLIDTASVYGDGHSERLIGKVLKDRRAAESNAKVYIATKIPPKTMRWPVRSSVPVSESFPRHWIVQSTERSLKNLGIETIDLLQLHAWADEYTEKLEWYEALVQLRDQGKARAFGVSLNDNAPQTGVHLAKSGRVDAIQVAYNIFDQSPESELFPAARENNVGILARAPFDQGLLTGALHADSLFDPKDWRAGYFTRDRLAEAEKRVHALRLLSDDETPTLALLALRFCLHSPAVTCVLAGMRQVAHVEANAAASQTQLTQHTMAALRRHGWQRCWTDPEIDRATPQPSPSGEAARRPPDGPTAVPPI
jgi:aryl-alcohol dehydrogenase-like predicted oxidoreductase